MRRIIALSFPVLLILLADSTVQAGIVQLPQTGQQTCWVESEDYGWIAGDCNGTGQDGEKRIGAALPATDPVTSRFTSNTDGTVTDQLNGLIWLKDANCTDTIGGIAKSNGLLAWQDAFTWTAGLAGGACGLSDGSVAGDWRLPNIGELESLLNDQHPDKAAWLNSQGFSSVQSEKYWSSTTRTSSSHSAWFVNMGSGVMNGDYKAFGNHVWPVRGGVAP